MPLADEEFPYPKLIPPSPTRQTVNPRMAVYFNTPDFSDLDLTLHDPTGKTTTFPAHRVVLASASEFFRKLLVGPFHEAGKRAVTVEVPDLERAVELVEWIYTRQPFVPAALRGLAEQWLVAGVRVEETIPYPGETSTFVLGDKWGPRIYPSLDGLLYRLEFRATSLESTLQRLVIQMWVDRDEPATGRCNYCDARVPPCGRCNNGQSSPAWTRLRIILGVKVPNHSFMRLKDPEFQAALQASDELQQKVRAYFHQYHLVLMPLGMDGHWIAETDPIARQVLERVLQNNTFSPEDTATLTALANGKSESWTPPAEAD